MHLPTTTSRRSSGPIYLYCLTAADRLETVRGKGIDPAFPLSVHSFDGLGAVVSGVDVDTFTGPHAEADLQDIQWVAPRASRHADVVQQIMETTRVMPVRFGTIFSSLEAMAEALGRHRGTIGDFLTGLGNRKEFAVKGYMNRKSVLNGLVDAAMSEARHRLDELAPGARYFQEKRIQRESENRLADWLHQCRQAIADQMTAGGRELAELRLQRLEEGDADPLEMILNWALLVDDDERSAFHATIDAINNQWAAHGITLESSGPWPPYSFCPRLGWEAGEVS